MDSFASALTVPDLWQQKAVRLLRAGHDAIVHAPTGAGKTFVFESLVESGFGGKSVFTVPTRALANDKLHEWRKRGWNVGIETGDVSHNTKAPVIVATLEAQKRKLIGGRGPKLLVIDEYQMIGDLSRGANYELAVALAPAETQLLLLSGSVANPGDVVRWLERCGRPAVAVRHDERPVPLDEVHLDALPALNRSRAAAIHGRWPRYVARVLQANFGPLLMFAPRRKSAESLALTLASALGENDPLELTAEQKAVAGPELTRCLKSRVAFHHSGMPYNQRAGLVEPLAKHNQLKVIVATTGLAAGINFSMRSVLVLDREYRVADAHRQLRPDELLQMFGRAGRRGLDERGSVLYLDGKPRLADARPLRLKRGGPIDWPSLIAVLERAQRSGTPPLKAARKLTERLFSESRIALGLEDFLTERPVPAPSEPALKPEQSLSGGSVTEFLNSAGVWERRRAPVLCKLRDTWYRGDGEWRPGLSHPRLMQSIRIGSVWKTGRGRDRRYGIEAPVGQFPGEADDDRLRLSPWLRKALRNLQREDGQRPNVPRLWTLERIERTIVPKFPRLTRGGAFVEWSERRNTLFARLDYADAEIHAFRDLEGKGLLNPKTRTRSIAGTESPAAPDAAGPGGREPRSVAEHWHRLGLIDAGAKPTRRGILFSFFNHGEGLAVAAALEAGTYPIEEIVYDLANLRAGHRFSALALAGRPLAALCHERYGLRTIPGYLRRGLPEDYGDGASEILYNVVHKSSRPEAYLDEELSLGDIERARVEWRSLLAHIAHAPDLDWPRWRELQAACRREVDDRRPGLPFDELPPLTRRQTAGYGSP